VPVAALPPLVMPHAFREIPRYHVGIGDLRIK
jgi:hypothetical protein